MTQAIIAGVIVGLGGIIFEYFRRRKAEQDRARADSLESHVSGDDDADATEARLIIVKEKAEREPLDPLDWR